MCDVCCAHAALEATARGAAACFAWHPDCPDDTGKGIDNNPHAPPMVDAIPPEDPTWPRVFIQAEGEAEGPGRVRVALLPEGPWSDWIAVPDVACGMTVLGVDVKWSWVYDRIKQAVLAGDLAALIAILQAEAALDRESDEVEARLAKACRGRRDPRLLRKRIANAILVEVFRFERDEDDARAIRLLHAVAWGIMPRAPMGRVRRPKAKARKVDHD